MDCDVRPWLASNPWRNITSSFHPSFRLFYSLIIFNIINNLLLPWATYDLCFRYTPGCPGITANQLVLVIPCHLLWVTSSSSSQGYSLTESVYCADQKHVTLIVEYNIHQFSLLDGFPSSLSDFSISLIHWERNYRPKYPLVSSVYWDIVLA